MSYTVENALYQWQDGQDRVRAEPEPARRHLERGVDAVVDELRRRLGSRFLLSELADFYAQGTDWAADLAARSVGSADAAAVVDAAFGRYAREASNYAGGRTLEEHDRP